MPLHPEIRAEFSASKPGELEGVMIADGSRAQESRPLSGEDRANLVAKAAKALREGYVYPEVGDAMAKDLEAKLGSGEYDNVEERVRRLRRRSRATAAR